LLKLDEVGSQSQSLTDQCSVGCVWWAGGEKNICDNISPDHVSIFSLTSNQSLQAEGAWSSAQASFIAQTKRVDICHQLD